MLFINHVLKFKYHTDCIKVDSLKVDCNSRF